MSCEGESSLWDAIKMPPPAGLPLRLSVGGYLLCFFVCCVLCVLFYWSGCTSITLALCGFACACACTCTYARCQAYGTDINHIAQQAHSHTQTHTKHPHININIHTPHTTPASAIACMTQLYELRRLPASKYPCLPYILSAAHTGD